MERLAENEKVTSVGSKRASYFTAMAESFDWLYECMQIYPKDPWCGLDYVEPRPSRTSTGSATGTYTARSNPVPASPRPLEIKQADRARTWVHKEPLQARVLQGASERGEDPRLIASLLMRRLRQRFQRGRSGSCPLPRSTPSPRPRSASAARRVPPTFAPTSAPAGTHSPPHCGSSASTRAFAEKAAHQIQVHVIAKMSHPVLLRLLVRNGKR